MKKREGDALDQWLGDTDFATVIQTNGTIDKLYRAHCLSGDAKKAAGIWGEFPRMLGKLIDTCGNHVFVLPITRQPRSWTVTFPTRDAAQTKPNLALIEQSAKELVHLADAYQWERVFLNRPGYDHIGTDWQKDVRPILLPILDDRFVICYDEKAEQEKADKKAHRRPRATRMKL